MQTGPRRLVPAVGLILACLISVIGQARAEWAATIQADNPAYWWRFETATTVAGVPNEGSTPGFDGVFGGGISDLDLGGWSATAGLGTALEFRGPASGTSSAKYVDFGAGIPELINIRPAAVAKETSVEYWVNTQVRGSYGDYWFASPALLAHEISGDGDIFWGWFNEFGDFGFGTGDRNELTDRRNGDGSVQVADGQWHHVVLVKRWDPIGPSRSIMIVDGGPQADGFVAEYPTDGGEQSYQDAGAFIRGLGYNVGSWAANVQFIGLIDELAIYDRELNDVDAFRHYYSAFPDTDGDGMADNFETKHGLIVGVDDSGDDLDGDGDSNLAEFQRSTNPSGADTDGDGLTDGQETGTGTWVGPIDTGTDPLDPDTDDDGFADGLERNTGILLGMNDPGTNPNLADTDGDGTEDHDEARYGSDPTAASVTPYLAPTYNGPPGVWTWELNNVQVAWDHGAGIRDETEGGDRWLFWAGARNASEFGDPTMYMGARIRNAHVTYFFGFSDGTFLTTSHWNSDWSTTPVDLTAAFGFSGAGSNDVSDRLRFRAIATEGPGGQSDWSISAEIFNLDKSSVIATYSPAGTAVDSVHQGTAQWDWWGLDPGVINLDGHQGVKMWVSPHPLGLHDTDDDSIDDAWEIANFGDLDQGKDTDDDADGLTDSDEFRAGTDPKEPDTDSDGATDAYEIAQGSNPNDGSSVPPYFLDGPPGFGEDLNGNWMSDVWEFWSGSFTLSPLEDTDGDGVLNWREATAGTDPFDPDSYLHLEIGVAPPDVVLSWDAVAYKGYEIWSTLDLAAWTNLTGPGSLRYLSPTTAEVAVAPGPDTESFRLTAGDGDADGDGVTDWSEWVLGSTVEGPDLDASRNSLRQSVQTSTGPVVYGDFVAMAERLGPISGGEAPALPEGSGPSTPDGASAAQASRFLTQATFGPTMEDIAHVQEVGFDAWITEQIAEPPYLFEPYMIHIWNDFLGPQSDPAYNRPDTGTFLFGNNFTTPFIRAVTQSDDLLRQRVAFALSQILVVSRRDAALDGMVRGLASYYDIFVRNALGNYRDVLREVTFHPCMGRYLSHIGNQKADPAIPRYPDENFAREVKQLMSIGLWELNPDGSRILNNGEPVPTYSNQEITEFARVFTGLWYPGREWAYGGWTDLDFAFPMEMHAEYHDFDEKTLFPDRGLSGRPEITIPARAETKANGIQDIDDALDALMMHPNTPPFICKQLIQFLVTSNPSGEYVQRVQDVFVDNGAGVRGDLAAVVRAVLLDDEARNPFFSQQSASFGKLREPVVRTMAIARAFRIGRHENLTWWSWGDLPAQTSQEPLYSPSVFNFYRPNYQAPALIDDGLVSPVFQITDSYTSISVPNLLWEFLTEGLPTDGWDYSLDFGSEILLADSPEALADRMNLLFCQGHMDALTRADIIGAVEAIPEDQPGSRVALAAYLALCSPQGAIQR